MGENALRMAVKARFNAIVHGPGPTPRSEADQVLVIDWLERAVDTVAQGRGDDEDIALLSGVLTDTVEIVIVHGTVRFRLTQAGEAQAVQALLRMHVDDRTH